MMNQETINFILQRMVVFLDNAQMLKLKDILDEIARQEDTTLLTKSSEELHDAEAPFRSGRLEKMIAKYEHKI